MTLWILSLMLALQPSAPWLATYRDTAVAIDRAAHAEPLYEDEDGAARTAAELVAIAWFESRFDPSAVAEDGSGSVCLGQIDLSNLDRLLTTRNALLADVDLCVHSMLRLVRESHRVCALRRQPAEDRLAQYTGGGGACDRGRRESRLRARLAEHLLRAHPVRWIERTPTMTTVNVNETTEAGQQGQQGGQPGGQPKPGQQGNPGPQPGTTHPQPGSTQPQPGQQSPKK